MKISSPEFRHPDTNFTRLPSVFEIDGNERAYILLELDLKPPQGGLDRRYQIIVVWRENILLQAQLPTGELRRAEYTGKCQFMLDMGLSCLFVNRPHSIRSAAFETDAPEDWCHTVDEVMYMAEQLRETGLDQFLEPPQDDLVAGYHDMVDQAVRDWKHLSVVGPHYKVERN